MKTKDVEVKVEHTMLKVWDEFIRLFHWSLVIAVSFAAYSGFLLGGTWITAHIAAGTVAAVLIFARILWGIWGTPAARFEYFVAGVKETFHHIRELRSPNPTRHVGHNPLGALMIVTLIGVIFLLSASGLAILGGVFKVGPLAPDVTYQIGVTTKFVHKLLAIGLLALVAMHIGGAIFESFRNRENLIHSMITGHKEIREGDHPLPKVNAWPIFTILVFAAGTGFMFWNGSLLATRPIGQLPPTTYDATYADECSACHIAYNPSLLSTKAWTLLMNDLSNHFGEDASLDPETVASLTDWLSQNSADTVDTKPAHVLMTMAADAPFTITATPFWKNTHRNIAPETFTRAPIYDNGNCSACHADADSGRFYPANITIPPKPKEITQ